MLRFLYVVPFEKSFDSSTECGKGNHKRSILSYLFYLMFGELRLKPDVSTSATFLA